MTDQPSGWSEVLGGVVVSIFLAVAVEFFAVRWPRLKIVGMILTSIGLLQTECSPLER